MGIAVVAVIDIGEHCTEVRRLSFLQQLVVATLCAYLGSSSQEELEFGLREDHRTDVSAVHDDAFLQSHLLLLGNEESTYLFDGRDTAGSVADLKGTDLRLDVFAVEGDMLRAVNEDESDLDSWQGSDDICLLGQVMVQGIEGDGAVHSAGIDIGIAGVFGQRFGDRRFATAAISVDGNNNLFHISYLFISELISKVRPTW